MHPDSRRLLRDSTFRAASRRGLSRSDLLIGLACGVVSLSVAIPVLARNGIDSGEARSLSNLRTLAAAHEAYSASFDGKQFGVMPEDAGLVNGSCELYTAAIACPPPLLLGQSGSGGWWGYFLSYGLCSSYGYPSTAGCLSWGVYKPIKFAGADSGFGSFRLPNANAFNAFVDGRFYSDTFYSPNDRLAYDMSAQLRDVGADFEPISGSDLAFSSYCLSPAAMYHPDVLSAANGGFKNPDILANGYVSPTVSQCTYPELKTRLIEHNWNHGAPSFISPAQPSLSLPWFYNASALAAPNGFFFDGHVTRIKNAQAMADDAARIASEGIGLWSRTTPLGAGGYYSSLFSEGVTTSHTILTIDGILGRDVLTPQ